MAFNYTASGGITLRGCATYDEKFNLVVKYGIGSKVYYCKAAQRGCLEAVVIKAYRIINNKLTNGKFVTLYTDTLNALWNEYDLCTETEAVQIALAYWQGIRVYQQQVLNCTAPGFPTI